MNKQLEEEKKLVADFMGWKVVLIKGDDTYKDVYWIKFQAKYTHPAKLDMKLKYWDPQSKRKWWDEIFAIIDTNKEIKKKYVCYVIHFINIDANMVSKWDVHTAKTEICWEALIKTLEKNEQTT